MDPPIPVHELLAALTDGLVERDEAARLLLLAALAGEHVLFVGPPGTAKSELARRLGKRLIGGAYFERLLTKFSVPEELFGPLSLKAIERDEYTRLTEGYLPTAQVAFLDEIFHANSAILNALLTLLNEREFDNGVRREACPLAVVVAATNAVPDAPELEALLDRFLFRVRVEPVTGDGFERLLALGDAPSAETVGPTLSLDDLASVRVAAARVRVSGAMRALLAALRQSLQGESTYVSDRRWTRLVGALRVAACTDGRDEVGLAEAPLLRHALWNKPNEAARIDEMVHAALDQLLVLEPKRFELLCGALEEQNTRELAELEQRLDAEGRPLFMKDDETLVANPYDIRPILDPTSGEPLFIAPAQLEKEQIRRRFSLDQLWELYFSRRARGVAELEAWIDNPENRAVTKILRPPAKEPARFSDEHVRARTAQIDELARDVASFARSLAGLDASARTSTWASASSAQTVDERLREAIAETSAVHLRAEALCTAVRRLRVKDP